MRDRFISTVLQSGSLLLFRQLWGDTAFPELTSPRGLLATESSGALLTLESSWGSLSASPSHQSLAGEGGRKRREALLGSQHIRQGSSHGAGWLLIETENFTEEPWLNA